MKPDYYHVLGVDRGASTGEIHRAWREVARDRHPDRRPEDSTDTAAMVLANEAWVVLADPESRRAYDLSLRVPEPPQVREAILEAACTVLLGAGTSQVRGGRVSFTLARESVRVAVETFETLDGETLGAWLPTAVADPRLRSHDCVVLMACRVLDPDEMRLRLEKARIPVIAIDLMESRACGEFPSEQVRELFGSFLAR